MKNLDRNDFISKTSKTLGILLLSYLLYKFAFAIWVGSTVETWKFLAAIIALFYVLFVLARAFRKLVSIYIARVGEPAKTDIATLQAVFTILVFGFACVMAMRAFYSERIDSLVVWGALSVYVIYQLFIDIRLVNKKLEESDAKNARFNYAFCALKEDVSWKLKLAKGLFLYSSELLKVKRLKS